MAVNPNHAGFDRRLTRVQELLQDHNLEVDNISPLAYDTNYRYPYNNFLFKVKLASPALASTFPGTQPGTCKAPSDGVSVLVVKLSNPAASDVNNANRVANDVAAQKLVRECLADPDYYIMEQVVPDVYAWAPATTTDPADEKGFGWIMSEFRAGVTLESVLSEFPYEDLKRALEQVKNVYNAIRLADLPEGVTKFGGGLKFDSEGQVMDGEAPIKHDVKPAGSYLEWRVGYLRAQIGAATKSPVIQGWERNGVLARIEAFLNGGGPEKVLADVKIDRKCLIHGDLTTNNLLWDPEARKITAVLDFDFAHVNHRVEEFHSMSFNDLGGSIGFSGDSIEEALISGDFTTMEDDVLPDDVPEDQWLLAKDWNEALDYLAPSNIDGVEGIVDLLQLQILLCPHRLTMEVMSKEYNLANFADEKKEEIRAETEAELVEWLEKHGF